MATDLGRAKSTPTSKYDAFVAAQLAQAEKRIRFLDLTAGLLGECTVANGRIEQENFDTYPILRMADMPAVDSIVMPSGGFWGGVGEPTIAVATPAVFNAIFAATGKRIRSIPLKSENISFA